jgi:hypothetical protein
VSPVKYELGFCVPEDDILHSHRCENLRPYMETDSVHEMLYFIILRILDAEERSETKWFWLSHIASKLTSAP